MSTAPDRLFTTSHPFGGVPGLAKTLTVNTLAKCLHLDFKQNASLRPITSSEIWSERYFTTSRMKFWSKKDRFFKIWSCRWGQTDLPAKYSQHFEACRRSKSLSETRLHARSTIFCAGPHKIRMTRGTYPLPKLSRSSLWWKYTMTILAKPRMKWEVMASNGKLWLSAQMSILVLTKQRCIWYQKWYPTRENGRAT